MVRGTHDSSEDDRNASVLIYVNGVMTPRDEAKISVFDSGYPKLKGLCDAIVKAGQEPIVIDSKILLQSPKRTLEKLCEKLGIPFSDTMLSWPEGPKKEDGVWAPIGITTSTDRPASLHIVPKRNCSQSSCNRFSRNASRCTMRWNATLSRIG